MKLLDILVLLMDVYTYRFRDIPDVFFEDKGFSFWITPTPKGVQLRASNNRTHSFTGLITGKDNDFTAIIHHLEGLKLSNFYSSME